MDGVVRRPLAVAGVLLLALSVLAVRQDASSSLDLQSERAAVGEDRRSRVKVINLTGQRITALALVHKYSEDEPEKFFEGSLEPGQESAGFDVKYRTGFMRLGQDWWRLAWCSSDGTQFFISDPNSFRVVWDFMEKWVKGTIGGLLSQAVTLVTFGVPVTTSKGKLLGRAIADMIAAGDGGTAGFERFSLSEADDGAEVRIELRPNGKIAFGAPSGVAETVYVEKYLDDQSAKAVVVNLLGQRISAVALSHKYSDEDPETTSFAHLEHGESSQPMTVHFRTGFLRIGSDWWKLGWFSDDGKDHFVTVTGEMSTVLNTVEKVAVHEAVGAAVEGVQEHLELHGNLAHVASHSLAGTTAHAFHGAHGEDGYERHTLTADDAGKTVTLHLLPGGIIRVFSPSGPSSELSYIKIGEGTTKRASVVVVNKSGRRVAALALVHKYSDDEPEKHTVAALESGERSAGLPVHYRTGFGRTGQDWWKLAWCSSDGTQVFATQGGALNGVLDVLGGTLAATAGAAVKLGLTSVGVPLGVGPASHLAGDLATDLIGKGGTAGYEKLTLTDEDMNREVTVTLLPPDAEGNGRVEIRAPSGSTTETDYKLESR